MFRKSLAGVFGGLIISSSCLAADLPSKSAPALFVPPASSVPTWAGFSVGGQIGYEFGRDSVFAPGLFPAVPVSASGVIGGAHVGYDVQTNQFIFGLEGDVNGSSYSGSSANPLSPFAGSIVGSRIPIDGSLRGRVGIGFDRTLLYATGGGAIASIRDTYFAPIGGGAVVSRTRLGYTIGGGIDYALNANWSAGVAYRFTDYGTFSDLPGTVAIARVHHETDNRIQARLSYRFETLAPVTPVVARY